MTLRSTCKFCDKVIMRVKVGAVTAWTTDESVAGGLCREAKNGRHVPGAHPLLEDIFKELREMIEEFE